MSEAELIFTALAELSTRQIAESGCATGMEENESAAQTGGRIAKSARLALESKTGKTVVSGENYLCTGSDCLDTLLQLRPPFAWHRPDGLQGVT